MASAAVIIAITDLLVVGSRILQEYNAGELTDEELAERWKQIRSDIEAANARWEAAGDPN